MAFFRERSQRNRFRDFLDSSSDWYLATLLATTAVSQLVRLGPRPVTVLDLGCGRGGFCRWLCDHSKSPVRYFGVDQDPGVIALCESKLGGRGTFLCADARRLDTHVADADAIFAINLFPYLINPLPILASCRDLLRPGGFLLVLDPEDSLFWKHELPGFGLTLRGVRDWIPIASESGWRILEIASLGFFSLRGRPVVPIANAIVLVPQDTTVPS
jgi:SAM-dependent methyltransferase